MIPLLCFLSLGVALLFAPPAVVCAQAPSPPDVPTPLLRADSEFVWVPALVQLKDGETARSIDLSRLRLFDNGTPEKLTRIDTDGLPISLVILMQTGASGGRFLPIYADLPPLIDRLLAGSVHELTLATFDSRVEQIWHFPARSDGVTYALTHQSAGDSGAAIRDAVAFGVRQLQDEPGRFRRVILLIGQETDAGSVTSSRGLLQQLGGSSTVVYSLRLGSAPTRRMQAPGRVRAESALQAAEMAERQLQDDTAAEIARLTGGAESHFDDQRSFNSAMLEIAADFRNGITLGFQPSRHEPGFHRIDLQSNAPGLRVTGRSAYWSDPSK